MKNHLKIDKKKVSEIVKNWLEEVIIGLNICPFAKEPYINQRVRISILLDKKQVNWFSEFSKELEHLQVNPFIDTTLWVLPFFVQKLTIFYELYLQCDLYLMNSKRYKDFQIVFFHPDANIQGVEPISPKQLVIKAPFPIIHILRTPQVEALGAKIKKDVHLANDERLGNMPLDEYQMIWKKLFEWNANR